jgi:hypothetical protein
MRLLISRLEVWRCESHLNSDLYWGQNGVDDCLDFTTNLDCYIFGINVFGSTQYSGQHDVNVNISEGSTILGSTSKKINSVPGKESYPIDFIEPLRILKNTTYSITLNMKGANCFTGTDYKAIVKIDDDLTWLKIYHMNKHFTILHSICHTFYTRLKFYLKSGRLKIIPGI